MLGNDLELALPLSMPNNTPIPRTAVSSTWTPKPRPSLILVLTFILWPSSASRPSARRSGFNAAVNLKSDYRHERELRVGPWPAPPPAATRNDTRAAILVSPFSQAHPTGDNRDQARQPYDPKSVRVLQQAGHVHQVPGHERRVAVREVPPRRFSCSSCTEYGQTFRSSGLAVWRFLSMATSSIAVGNRAFLGSMADDRVGVWALGAIDRAIRGGRGLPHGCGVGGVGFRRDRAWSREADERGVPCLRTREQLMRRAELHRTGAA